MFKHSLKIFMNITGKINEKDAGVVAKRYTLAALLLSLAALVLVIGKVLHWLLPLLM